MDKKGAGVHQTTVGELPNFRHDPRILCNPGNADLFFHPDGEKGAAKRWREWAARRLCSRCPLAAACDEFAARTQQTHGTWGATTADQRNTNSRKAAA